MAFPWLSWCTFCRKTPMECSVDSLDDLRQQDELYQTAVKLLDKKINKRAATLPTCPDCTSFLQSVYSFSVVCSQTHSFYTELKKKCQPQEYEADLRAEQEEEEAKQQLTRLTPTTTDEFYTRGHPTVLEEVTITKAKSRKTRHESPVRRTPKEERAQPVPAEDNEVVESFDISILNGKHDEEYEIILPQSHPAVEPTQIPEPDITALYPDDRQGEQQEEECFNVADVPESEEEDVKTPVILNPGKEQLFKCNECGEVWPNKSALDRHSRKHQRQPQNKPKPFECETCGQRFATKGALKEHSAVHAEATLKCDHCPKSFKNKQRLKLHMDSHSDTVYPCSICGAVLNTKRTLNSHMAVHSDVKNFKCDLCGAAFKRTKSLKTHMLIHTGKQFQCEFCNKEFSCASNLRVHKRTLHAKELAEHDEEKSVKSKLPTLTELKAGLRKS